jgi:hypothetical protein
MKRILFITSLLLVSPPLSAQAAGTVEKTKFETSPIAGVCQGVIIVPHKYAQNDEDKEFWNKAINECHVNAMVLPDTGFFATMASRLGEEADQEQAADFLMKVGKRTLENLDYNNKVSELISHCADPKLQPNDPWFQQKTDAAVKAAGDNAELAGMERDFYDQSKCAARTKQIADLVKKKGSEFRVASAMMSYTGSAGNKLAHGLRKAGDLATLGKMDIVLPGEKVPLSDAEMAQVKNATTKLDAQVSAEVEDLKKTYLARIEEKKKDPQWQALGMNAIVEDASFPGWFRGWYTESGNGTNPNSPQAQLQMQIANQIQRQEHFPEFYKTYSNTLSDARILAYVNTRNPDGAAIKAAADQLLANGKQTRDEAAAKIKDVENGKVYQGNLSGFEEQGAVAFDMTAQQKVDRLSSFMQNGSVVREILQEEAATGNEQNICRSAIGVTKYISHKNTRNGVLIGAGLMVAGIGASVIGPAVLAGAGLTVSGAAISTTVGAVTSAGSLVADGHRYLETKRRTLNYAHGDQDTFGAGVALNDVGQLQDARNAFVINAAITLATTAIPPMYSAFFAENQTKYSTAQVMKLLKDKGMTENEVKQLMRDFGSQDKGVASAAISKMAKAMGVDEGQIKTFQAVVQKQLLDPAGRDQVAAYSQRLHDLVKDSDPAVAAAKREKIYNQMQSLIGQLNENGVAPRNRADAMRVVLSASAFGEDDPKLIARAAGSINSWDDGLYGLSRAYDQARVNLSLEEIQALAPAARKEAAFKKALNQLGVNDPALVKQMCGCSGACSAQ